jgi:hypothetical protein
MVGRACHAYPIFEFLICLESRLILTFTILAVYGKSNEFYATKQNPTNPSKPLSGLTALQPCATVSGFRDPQLAFETQRVTAPQLARVDCDGSTCQGFWGIGSRMLPGMFVFTGSTWLYPTWFIQVSSGLARLLRHRADQRPFAQAIFSGWTGLDSGFAGAATAKSASPVHPRGAVVPKHISQALSTRCSARPPACFKVVGRSYFPPIASNGSNLSRHLCPAGRDEIS